MELIVALLLFAIGGLALAGTSALIGRALTRAAERNSALARPEHLLLAIVDEPESAAAKLLASLGATRERVREIVDRKAR